MRLADGRPVEEPSSWRLTELTGRLAVDAPPMQQYPRGAVRGSDLIRMELQRRLLVQPGEWLVDLDLGVDLSSVLK